MPTCQTEGCSADAVIVTKVQPLAPGGVPVFEVRCDEHKLTRPDGTSAVLFPLPPEA